MYFETTRRRFLALLSSLIAFPQTRAVALPESAAPAPLKSAAPDVLLFFTQPAPEWAAALPVGNGRIGAMVFGRVNQERIALNEDTLWSGGPTDWNNPDAKNHLPVVRQLLLQQKDYQGADAECRNMQGPYNQAYQPVGDLLIDFAHTGAVSGYRRELDLNTALATVTYHADGATYTRETFASAPAQVVVIRPACSKPGGLNCKVHLSSQLHSQIEVSGSEIRLTGKAPNESAPNYLFAPGSRSDLFIPPSVHTPGESATAPTRRTPPVMNDEEKAAQVQSDRLAEDPIQYSDAEGKGMHFAAVLHANCSGGRITRGPDDTLSIEGANELLLLVGMATGYRDHAVVPDKPLTQVLAAAAQPVNAARAMPYERLRRASVADHQSLFRRVRLDLGTEKNASPLPTDQRVTGMATNPDPSLLALYFNLGRYLLITSSRPGTQPANLQGIWNAELRPPWSSNWTSNINLQMNYWHVETTNLSECHMPLFDMVTDLSKNGAVTAQVNYGAKGWVSLHALQRIRSHGRRTHFMNVSRRQFALAALTLAASAQFASARTPKKLKVLVVDGMNNHTWKVATAAIREILIDTDLFTVDVSTTPPADADTNAWDSWRPDFFRYDVVVNNFNSGYDAKAILWPQPVRQALEKYVSGGGGLVSYHAANNAFLLWPEYNQMIGMGWRTKTYGPSVHIGDHDEVIVVPQGEGFEPNHPPRFDFQIHVRDTHHPITRGMPRVWLHPSEQLTHGQHGSIEGFTFLTYALSPITKQNEPMDWVHTYGKGRVYTTMLGHTWANEPSPDLDCVGFQTLFARGVQWAATGRVTIPIPSDFPGPDHISLHALKLPPPT